jgi:hypothetical protein
VATLTSRSVGVVRGHLGPIVLGLALLGTTACSTPTESSPAPSATDGGASIGPTGFHGRALAGPTCPVVRPNDPACADRPIAGATIHVLDATGTEIAVLTTDPAGAFGLGVPAGVYRLVADPVPGLMRAPAPTDVEVGTGVSEIDLAFDTGIR